MEVDSDLKKDLDTVKAAKEAYEDAYQAAWDAYRIYEAAKDARDAAFNAYRAVRDANRKLN